ncbi:MAG: hypothetical protein AABO58_20415 [Acidobacteriota bacterium]
MSEPQSLQPKYGRRFIVNAILLAVVWTLAWMWFNAHVKPHISVALFSGVSFATLGVFAYGAFRSFVDTGAAQNIVRERLRLKSTTMMLAAFLSLLVFAYLTTFTVYFNAGGKFDVVKLDVIGKSSKKPRPVELTSAERQKAVSYFFAFRAVTLQVSTRMPNGYAALDLPLRRGIPTQLNVPDACPEKPYFLVRLVPLDDLFKLRGRKEPDPSYVVRVFLPGRPQPIERRGLSFHAIYLGAALTDLQLQSKSARGSVAELRNRLRAYDEMSNSDIDSIVADWLDDPEFIATPELKEGQKVRVEVEGPDGTSETTVRVSAKLNDAFLKGAVE